MDSDPVQMEEANEHGKHDLSYSQGQDHSPPVAHLPDGDIFSRSPPTPSKCGPYTLSKHDHRLASHLEGVGGEREKISPSGKCATEGKEDCRSHGQ
jgi:hypothetical protein